MFFRIFLPIVMRTTVSWMARPPNFVNNTIVNENHTQASFGFVYGTIPTAPSVVVFASIYGLSEDVVSVLCSFLKIMRDVDFDFLKIIL